MKTLTFLIAFLFSVHAWALNWVADIVLSPAPLTYSGPANSIVPGNVIGSSWSATADVQEVFWSGLLFLCSKGTMEPGSGTVSTCMNITADGKNYTIFETGIPGIGYIIGLKDFNGSAYMPLQNGVTPTVNATLITAYNNETKTASVIINPTTITVTTTGCVVITKSANINLGAVDIRQLPTVGSMATAGAFNITLDCDAGISLSAVLSDQSYPSNNSDAAALTSDSTAGILGVTFYYNGTGPLQLGQDSSAAGTANQFYITATAAVQTVSLPCQVRYVRKGPIVPGTANALASLTFSCQ